MHLKTRCLFRSSRYYLRSLRSINWLIKKEPHPILNWIAWKGSIGMLSSAPANTAPKLPTKHFQHILEFSSIHRNSINSSLLGLATKSRSRGIEGMRRADSLRTGWAELDVQSVILLSLFTYLGSLPSMLHHAVDDWLQSDKPSFGLLSDVPDGNFLLLSY